VPTLQPDGTLGSILMIYTRLGIKGMIPAQGALVRALRATKKAIIKKRGHN